AGSWRGSIGSEPAGGDPTVCYTARPIKMSGCAMDRSHLHRLLPHQGSALWLDQLLEHDAQQIRGLSHWSHLQAFGADASPCYLFEAAAQLCALHGVLHGGEQPVRM